MSLSKTLLCRNAALMLTEASLNLKLAEIAISSLKDSFEAIGFDLICNIYLILFGYIFDATKSTN